MGGAGIAQVPNAVRAGLEAQDRMYSDADFSIPMYCRWRDEVNGPDALPTRVTMLSMADGSLVHYSATERMAHSLHGVDEETRSEMIRDLFDRSHATVIHTGVHFDRVVERPA